ncbi:hypothetical protein CL649_04210 [bacterium]|nr:hypothetical protein [bacterium]|tara:strand:- start:44 stop:520 length:477 start_codon:yes stop_codon:yes gene_type:complete
MEVRWERHEIKILNQELMVEPYLQISAKGLDTNAQNLHQDFIKNLPHLSEVRNDHIEIFSEIASDIETAKMNIRDLLSTNDILNEFDGEIDEKGISLPIKIRSADDIIIQSRMENENQIVQIISSNINGGIFRSFVMPDDCQINSITSGNGIIEILFR